MGSNQFDDEKPVHRVTFKKGFWVGETEVTQIQYRVVMPNNPDPSYFKGDDRPVERVTALDGDEFCDVVRRTTGLRVYLLKEDEWEYACRAGVPTNYHTGNDEMALKLVGWYDGNSGYETHPVGKLAPNAWGIHDMHGNVWEWCQDEFGPYQGGDQIVSQTDFGKRIIRGGSFSQSPLRSRAANRGRFQPDSHYNDIGFRVCIRLD